MSEPIAISAESAVAPGTLATAGLAEMPDDTATLPTQDELPCDDGLFPMDTPYEIAMPPTQDELPYDDGEPMESQRHLYQIFLLIETLKLHWADRDDYFAGGNMFVYFSTAQVKKNDFRGPDFFVALGVDGKRERKSWVVWEEGKGPDLVIEFLSESTAAFDREGKKKIYHDKLHVPEYFYFDPFSGELAGFRMNGDGYLPKTPDDRDRFISSATGLALARWEGEYLGVTGTWLRWETIDGKLLPTENERAEQEHERAERLAARLRELGVDPASLD